MWIYLVLIILCFVPAFIFFFFCYKKCPQDKIMVIYGNVGKNPDGSAKSAVCVHGRGVFVFPIIQNYTFLDIKPLTFTANISDVLTKEKNYIDFSAAFTTQISTNKEVMINAAERLLNLNEAQIIELATKTVESAIHKFVEATDENEILDKDFGYLEKFLVFVNGELNLVGLFIVNTKINSVTLKSES